MKTATSPRGTCMSAICTGPLLICANFRHPRVQLEMLKNVFGGDAWVENVKIVPDRNVFISSCVG
jgi:hypothetical protein